MHWLRPSRSIGSHESHATRAQSTIKKHLLPFLPDDVINIVIGLITFQELFQLLYVYSLPPARVLSNLAMVRMGESADRLWTLTPPPSTFLRTERLMQPRAIHLNSHQALVIGTDTQTFDAFDMEWSRQSKAYVSRREVNGCIAVQGQTIYSQCDGLFQAIDRQSYQCRPLANPAAMLRPPGLWLDDTRFVCMDANSQLLSYDVARDQWSVLHPAYCGAAAAPESNGAEANRWQLALYDQQIYACRGGPGPSPVCQLMAFDMHRRRWQPLTSYRPSGSWDQSVSLVLHEVVVCNACLYARISLVRPRNHEYEVVWLDPSSSQVLRHRLVRCQLDARLIRWQEKASDLPESVIATFALYTGSADQAESKVVRHADSDSVLR